MKTTSGSVEIGGLSIHIPGLTPDEARSLGRDVAHLLAHRLQAETSSLGALPHNKPMKLDELGVRVVVPPGTPRSGLAYYIVQAVWEKVQAAYE